MPLKINCIALKFVAARAEEMVEAHFVKRRRGSVCRNVPADVVLDTVCAHHHGQCVPANEALDAALQFLIAGEKWFEARWNSVRVRGVRGERQVNAVDGSMRAESLENFLGHFRPA